MAAGRRRAAGGDLGPFLAVEQAAITQLLVVPSERTSVFAWYNMAGTLCVAVGSLCGGAIADVYGYRAVVLLYGFCGVLLGGPSAAPGPGSRSRAAGTANVVAGRHLFLPIAGRRARRRGCGRGGHDVRQYLRRHTPAHLAESATCVDAVAPSRRRHVGVTTRDADSGGLVLKLSLLFALDAFAGSLVLQSFISYWFNVRWQAVSAALGGIMFGVNVLAGLSALASSWYARLGALAVRRPSHAG